MAWIEGTEARKFKVDAPIDVVADFFCDPAQFQEAFGEMESCEELEDGVWKWTLVEKAEKGITFQGTYTVDYRRDGNTCEWTTRPGSNSKSTGRVVCTARGDKTEVDYTETLSFDLPIPKLAAKIFKPIVAREIRHGVGDFLDRGKEICES